MSSGLIDPKVRSVIIRRTRLSSARHRPAIMPTHSERDLTMTADSKGYRPDLLNHSSQRYSCTAQIERSTAKNCRKASRSPSENCFVKAASPSENRIVKKPIRVRGHEAPGNAFRWASREQPSPL